MLKLNNTCTAHPNVTMLLEKKVYARRKERKISQDHWPIKPGSHETVFSRWNAMNICQSF